MSGDHNMNQNDFNPDWDTVKAFDERHADDTALLRQCLEALEGIIDADDWLKTGKVRAALKERLK